MDMTPKVMGTFVLDPIASNAGERSRSGWRAKGELEWGCCSASALGEMVGGGEGRARAILALKRRGTAVRSMLVRCRRTGEKGESERWKMQDDAWER